MRASRLLAILNILQARGSATAGELATECEVSLRTIYRDVNALSASGVPVYSERGAQGCYRLLNGYRTQLNGLSPQEAEALFLAGLPGAAADLGLGAVMAAAQNKLLSAMPAATRAAAEQVRARFHLDTQAWFSQGEKLPEHLPQVADAVWARRVLHMRYRSWTRESERTVEPLGLVMKGGAWYLVAQAEGGDGSQAQVRTYRISSIQALTVLDRRFERPPAFDLGASWLAATRRLEASLHPNTATVRLSPWGLEMLGVLVSPHARAHAHIADEADAQGWRTVTMPIGALLEATTDLLSLGPNVEVLGPPALRARMAEAVAAMRAIYAHPPAEEGPVEGPFRPPPDPPADGGVSCRRSRSTPPS